MPRLRSYHGQPASISVQYTHSRLSRWGFTPVVLGYLRRLQLPERFASVTIHSATNAYSRPVDKLMTLVTLFVTGIARIDSNGEVAVAAGVAASPVPESASRARRIASNSR